MLLVFVKYKLLVIVFLVNPHLAHFCLLPGGYNFQICVTKTKEQLSGFAFQTSSLLSARLL